ncbi:hypothetical protein V6248_08095 [Pseudoalteromonas agarivorans]|uniref:O-antigen ligase family protein n=1 Tax=Pseudoalteromonas agarivorans TaxID=176102 RepID=UPI00311D65F2
MQKSKTPLNTAQWLVLSTLFVLCYWPTYFIPSIEPAVMQKSYFLVILVYLILIVLATKTNVSVPHVAYVYCFPLLAMLVSFSFTIEHFSAFHFSVLIKPILLFAYVVFFYSLLVENFNLTNGIKIKRALTTIFVLQIIVIILQIVFGDIAPLKILSFKEVYSGFGFRAPGTFDWVYITCYFLSFFLALYIIEFFFGSKKKSAALFIILAFLAIFLSQSKTGYLATIIIALYFTLLSIVLRLGIAKKIMFIMVIFLILFISSIIYFEINLDYITRFIDLLLRGRLDGSTSTRKGQTLLALKEGFEHWYSGSPMALQGSIIENSYLDYLFRYGLLGLFAFTSMLFIFYYYSLVVCIQCKQLYDKKQVSFELFQLSVACHISFFAASIYSFTGTPVDAYRSALWSSFIIALVTFINRLNRKAYQCTNTKRV